MGSCEWVSGAFGLGGVLVGFLLSEWQRRREHGRSIRSIKRVLGQELLRFYGQIVSCEDCKDVKDLTLAEIVRLAMYVNRDFPFYVKYLERLGSLDDEDFECVESAYAVARSLTGFATILLRPGFQAFSRDEERSYVVVFVNLLEKTRMAIESGLNPLGVNENSIRKYDQYRGTALRESEIVANLFDKSAAAQARP